MIEKHLKKVISISNQILNKKESPQTPFKSIIAIGTSTGGPKALLEVLQRLPDTIGAPIVIVQHMPKGFTKSLADRLNVQVGLTVKEAEDGDVLHKDTVYIAPGDYHMEVAKQGTRFIIRLNQNERQQGHRPSVNVLFNSVAKLPYLQKIAVILTGMGSDGTAGLRTLKTSDSSVIAIAESEKTSVVYGMPRAAVMTNLIDYICDLEKVSTKLLHVLKS